MAAEIRRSESNNEICSQVKEYPHRRISIADPSATGSGRLSPMTIQPNTQHFTRKISSNSEHLSDGPVRRKSILHNHNHYINHGFYNSEDEKHWNGEVNRSVSRSSSVHSIKKNQQQNEEEIHSWWYMLCTKCRQKETSPSWEPKHWQRFCPHPFCPSYRQFARLIALSLIVLLVWGIVFCIAGDTAAPGGQLFGLAFLTISAHFGGWLVSLISLPSLIGMLLIGVLYQNTGVVDINGDVTEITSVLREMALVVILTRAGLDLDMETMRKLRYTVLRLGLVPWIIECLVICVTSHYLLSLPWVWGFLLGAIIAAVSPAVVVPCLFRLRGKGYGVAKGIPTLIIAVSGIDDAASVAIFGIVHGLMFSSESLAFNIVQGPLSIVIGIGFGAIWGFLSRVIPEKQDPFVVPLRLLMLLGGGMLAVFGSRTIGLAGAGPLGCVTAAFFSGYVWSKDGWEVDDNPVATGFEIFWMIFEPILFGITGTLVVFKTLEGPIVGLACACLIIGVIIRMISTVGIGVGAGLNLKEKIFVALSWMAKATVQAALGPVSLESVSNDQDREYAQKVMLVCVLSILLTAPLGAVIITLSGPRLLTKTKSPPTTTEWRRRSHRPSMRDISIIDEEEEVDSSESNPPKTTETSIETDLKEKEKKISTISTIDGSHVL